MNHSYQMVFVSLKSDFALSTPITILRVTGASQLLTIPYLSLFAIIANNQVILFLIVLF